MSESFGLVEKSDANERMIWLTSASGPARRARCVREAIMINAGVLANSMIRVRMLVERLGSFVHLSS